MIFEVKSGGFEKNSTCSFTREKLQKNSALEFRLSQVSCCRYIVSKQSAYTK